MTLRELLSAHGASGFYLLEDHGGLALNIPTFIFFDEDDGFGNVEMRLLEVDDHLNPEAPIAADYSSDWITKTRAKKSYRVRLFF
jgi:hypothetical protein